MAEMTEKHSAEKAAVVDALVTHRHGEDKGACRWCARFYGDIYDRIKAAEASVIPPADPDDLCLTCGATNGVCRCTLAECNCDGDDGETGHDLLCPRLTRPIPPGETTEETR